MRPEPGRPREGASGRLRAACRSSFLLSIGAAALIPIAVQSSPALPGFTGVLETPTPFSQAYQSGAIGVTGGRDRSRVYLNYGLWETGELTLSGNPLDVRLHAKYTALPETERAPALAIGGTGLLSGSASLYAVAGANLRVREGGARVRLSGGVATRGALAPLFAAAEFRASRVAVLQAEWSRWWNVGIRLDPTAQFRVQVGLVRRRAALGISYDLGL